jgi:hypothetical protein
MAIRQGNFPYRVPYPTRSGLSQYGGSLFAKVVISADTTLVVDTNDEFVYNLLVNDSADADTDLLIPCFILPSGAMVEDVGVENFMVHTELANYQLGDSVDDDGWMDTVVFIATDTNAIGEIEWMHASISARYFLSVSTADASDVALLSTTVLPAYLSDGPRIVYSNSDYSTVAIVGLDSDDEPRPHEYSMGLTQSGAVDVTGGMAIYLKYNLSGLQIREPSSNLGDTGD